MIIEVAVDVVEKVDLASLEIIKGNYAIAENSEKLFVKLGTCFFSRKVYFSYRDD